MKSFETEPIEDASAVDPASENHQLVHLGLSVSDTSSATENGPMVVEDGVELADPILAGQEKEEKVEPPQHRRFSPPTREQLLCWIPFWGVILLGAILRFWALGDKPLHHDESLHAYYSLQLFHNMEHWLWCIGQGSPPAGYSCYVYTPLLHGPFQFHFIALVYKISQLLGAADNGVNTTTVRILAATLGTAIVALPYFLRDYLGKIGAWLASFLLAVSPGMVYFSRFAREDIYMAFFTLLMVVGVARYIRDRKMRWLVIAAAGFAFSYATKEATFLTILVFGSFLGALIAWEFGVKVPLRSRFHQESNLVALLPKTFAPVTLLGYLVVAGVAAKILFTWVKALSIYITDNTNAANIFVQKLKDYTVAIVPIIGILLGIFVLILLYREMSRKVPIMGRWGQASRVDPEKQPVLDTILTMPWTYWFFALLCGWTIFLLLFSVMFTNLRDGIGDGIWQGLYYWLQQQQVARGSQPWYYYLMLIPLYEQIGVVFALFGIVRCIAKPTRFRLFLVYWFVCNLFLYSWAAEKMPWLMIHITVPMLLLAAVGLEPFVMTCINLVKQLFVRLSSTKMPASSNENNKPVPGYPFAGSRVGVFASGAAILGVILAVLLLLPTVHNMYEVSYVHPADGPHEMMVYVQTTTDVNIVMSKVDTLDQKMFGGKHQMLIGVTTDATWPFAWYLRDYPNVCFDYPSGCPNWKDVPVIIAGGDNPYGVEQQYSGTASNPGRYVFHEYKMRSWWDEGYKPPACIPSSSNNSCAGQPAWGGVGPGLWLSYGDNPPPNAKFNLGLAAQHIWQWWWERRAIGDTGGAYDMVLFIRTDLSTAVGP